MIKKRAAILGILLIATIMITPCTVIGEESKILNDQNKNIDALKSEITTGNIRIQWRQEAKLEASDPGFYDAFGNAVCINGNYAFIGSPNDNTFTGSVYVFKRSNGQWVQETKLYASDAAPYSGFGSSVSADGNYLLVGDPDNNGYIGSAYVFTNNAGQWIQQARLAPSDGEPNDAFGYSVSLSGSYALIGAPYENNQNGSAYVFKRNGSTWSEEAKLSVVLPHSPHGAEFGRAIALSSDYAVIGSPLDEYSLGSAHIFKRTGTTWTKQESLYPLDAEVYDWFGSSVAICSDFALIGSITNDNGAAYMFQRSGEHWAETQELLASDGEEGDGFGCSVSLTKTYAVLGALGENHAEGAAYVFKRIDQTWIQEAKLTASDGIAEITFGTSVSISDNTILIGAPDAYWGTGSAYVFRHV